jgi:DNA-binding NarL/FixJ family response regulator
LLTQPADARVLGAEIRVIVVDDHELIRIGIRALLRNEPGFELVGEGRDGHDAVRLALNLAPDVIVMGVEVPGLNGIDATRRILEERNGSRVAVLLLAEDGTALERALRAGASGFVLKQGVSESLVAAVRKLARGDRYLCRRACGLLEEERPGADSASVDRDAAALSARQREIVQLVAEGRTTKEIAVRVGVSVKTVESHRQALMRKLGVDSVAALTKYAVRAGLTRLEP